MKSLLRFIFNLIRNTSLVLVILFFCAGYYFDKHPEEAKKLLPESSVEVLFHKVENDEQVADFVNIQGFEIPESNRSIKKITIPTKDGTAYLRLSQIMYADVDTLVTTNLQKIAISSSLIELNDRFQMDSEACFFKTKSTILNCHYIMQVIRVGTKYRGGSYSYQDYAVMEDGKRINISEEKSKELKALLEQISI